MVDTDFSLLRFDGDTARADAVYAGLTLLTASDVIGFAVSCPPHVNLDTIVLKLRDQASATRAFRRE
jgi:NADP-dependent 3-hydroxy acid dehydrogenase YdfG